MSKALSIAVIGGGAWGTALAAAAQRAGCDVIIWAREEDVVTAINTDHVNHRFLPDCALNPAIHATADMADLSAVQAVLMVTPAQYVRPTLVDLVPHLQPGIPIILCAKGIEQASGQLLSGVCADIAANHPVAILSGPTFAREVAENKPCALTLACKQKAIRTQLITALASPYFRLYASPDIIGAQVGGAVKNVLAIATGMVDGLALGENARAALITRGMAEIMRFGDHMGAQRDTLMGLSGLGDVLLTCSSRQSRNFSLGYDIGQGRAFADIMADRQTVAEGAHTARILAQLAQKHRVPMPIMNTVDQILHGGADIRHAVQALLSRPLTDETD